MYTTEPNQNPNASANRKAAPEARAKLPARTLEPEAKPSKTLLPAADQLISTNALPQDNAATPGPTTALRMAKNEEPYGPGIITARMRSATFSMPKAAPGARPTGPPKTRYFEPLHKYMGYWGNLEKAPLAEQRLDNLEKLADIIDGATSYVEINVPVVQAYEKLIQGLDNSKRPANETVIRAQVEALEPKIRDQIKAELRESINKKDASTHFQDIEIPASPHAQSKTAPKTISPEMFGMETDKSVLRRHLQELKAKHFKTRVVAGDFWFASEKTFSAFVDACEHIGSKEAPISAKLLLDAITPEPGKTTPGLRLYRVGDDNLTSDELTNTPSKPYENFGRGTRTSNECYDGLLRDGRLGGNLQAPDLPMYLRGGGAGQPATLCFSDRLGSACGPGQTGSLTSTFMHELIHHLDHRNQLFPALLRTFTHNEKQCTNEQEVLTTQWEGRVRGELGEPVRTSYICSTDSGLRVMNSMGDIEGKAVSWSQKFPPIQCPGPREKALHPEISSWPESSISHAQALGDINSPLTLPGFTPNLLQSLAVSNDSNIAGHIGLARIAIPVARLAATKLGLLSRANTTPQESSTTSSIDFSAVLRSAAETPPPQQPSQIARAGKEKVSPRGPIPSLELTRFPGRAGSGR